MRSESCPELWVQGQIFKMQLASVLIQQSDSSRFSSKVNDLTSPGQLAGFPVLGTNSLLLSKASVQLQSCWLTPRYGYHDSDFSYQTGHWCDLQASQLGMTLRCFSPLAACVPPSNTMRTSPREEAFQSELGQILRVLCMKCMVPLAIRTYLQPLTDSGNSLCCSGSLLDSRKQQLERGLS